MIVAVVRIGKTLGSLSLLIQALCSSVILLPIRIGLAPCCPVWNGKKLLVQRRMYTHMMINHPPLPVTPWLIVAMQQIIRLLSVQAEKLVNLLSIFALPKSKLI